MGRSSRPKPRHLGEKLLRIRLALELSQEGMLRRLGNMDGLTQTSISGYELNRREPPLVVLLRYAHIANVALDVLADDELDLPETLPAPKKSEGVERSQKRARRREQ